MKFLKHQTDLKFDKQLLLADLFELQQLTFYPQADSIQLVFYFRNTDSVWVSYAHPPFALLRPFSTLRVYYRPRFVVCQQKIVEKVKKVFFSWFFVLL